MYVWLYLTLLHYNSIFAALICNDNLPPLRTMYIKLVHQKHSNTTSQHIQYLLEILQPQVYVLDHIVCMVENTWKCTKDTLLCQDDPHSTFVGTASGYL